jgi:hypothetical protein
VKIAGATDPFVYAVGISGQGEAFNMQNDYLFSKTGIDDVDVSWKDDETLVVAYGSSGRIFRQAIVWRTMNVIYNKTSADAVSVPPR